ncbi:MAG: hypothetical protein ACJ74F_34175 [Mycobacterium sp.]|uniref:hypothetical protein n=1 Tax=Mycobacterium sp. TaxID=1785 RepID=UPI00389A85F9
MAQPVVRFLACAGLLAAGLLMGAGIASADSGLGGLGIGHENNNDSKPRNDTDQTPVSSPVVRIGAREDRGGFEVGPGGIRISRQPGFRGGFDISPDGPRLTIDERGISGAFNLGPSGSHVTFGPGSGGSGGGRDRGTQAELGPSGTRVESEAEVAASSQGSSEEVGADEESAMAQRLAIHIPIPRLLAGTGARTQSSFLTVVISVPTGSILRAYGQPQPRPAPTPSPSFRTSEVPSEMPDVEAIDSSPQGGSDYPVDELQPIRAPLVVAPPQVAPPVAPPRPVVPPVAPPALIAPPPAGGRPGGQLHVPSSIVAGAPPGIRGPGPTAGPPLRAAGAGPVEIPATRLGYQQYLRTAKMTDIAAVALPGVAGLLLMTVSGTLIGHRQARAGHMLRHTGATRFVE